MDSCGEETHKTRFVMICGEGSTKKKYREGSTKVVGESPKKENKARCLYVYWHEYARVIVRVGMGARTLRTKIRRGGSEARGQRGLGREEIAKIHRFEICRNLSAWAPRVCLAEEKCIKVHRD